MPVISIEQALVESTTLRGSCGDRSRESTPKLQLQRLVPAVRRRARDRNEGAAVNFKKITGDKKW